MATANAMLQSKLKAAASAIRRAKALYVTAGAGMGVDSGLPDFRGPEGFWRAYPALKHLKIQFSSMSNPEWFDSDPERAWGFFGHRYNLYTSTQPHAGFQILLDWAKDMKHGYYVFTSNVDGHFQRAGFSEDRVTECHGSINFLQCVSGDETIWPVPEDFKVEVDMKELRTTSTLPHGPPGKDTTLARPNILMFGDWAWMSTRTDGQEANMDVFQRKALLEDFVVIEIGAGLAVPTVRYHSESLVERSKHGTLIRINPTEPEISLRVKGDHIELPMKGLEALRAIDELLKTWFTSLDTCQYVCLFLFALS